MSSSIIRMASPPAAYRQRRANVAAAIDRPLLIFAGHAAARNYPANTHPFRPNSWYTWTGGPPIEHAALLITPKSDGQAGCALFRPATDPDDAAWCGKAPTDADYAAVAGLAVDALLPLDAIDARIRGRDPHAIIPPCVDTVAAGAKLGTVALSDDDARRLIDLRMCKDEHELAAMRQAAEIGMEAHRAAWAMVRPGATEAEIAAEFMGILTANRAGIPYNPIVTVRGEILHAVGYPNDLNDGGMLLLDASAESPTYYANDITRTAPVNGRWTPIQRHLYDTVLRANRECCDACRPGRRFREIHELAGKIICEGLIAAELLRGNAAELAARRAHTLFFTHGGGHLIGLDVHDMRDFADVAGYAAGRSRPTNFGDKFLRLDRDLLAGMCVTIEPGCYLTPGVWERTDLTAPLADAVNRAKVDALLKDSFGGIRIEHTVHVCASGTPELLTDALPTDGDSMIELLNL